MPFLVPGGAALPQLPSVFGQPLRLPLAGRHNAIRTRDPENRAATHWKFWARAVSSRVQRSQPHRRAFASRCAPADPRLLRRTLTTSLGRSPEYVDNGTGPVGVKPRRDVVARPDDHAEGPGGLPRAMAWGRWLWSLRGRQARSGGRGLGPWAAAAQRHEPGLAALMRVAPSRRCRPVPAAAFPRAPAARCSGDRHASSAGGTA